MREIYTKNILDKTITIEIKNNKLVKLDFTKNKVSSELPSFAMNIFHQLEMYFTGKLTQFSIPCEFQYKYKYQKEFYRELSKIKFGQSIDYQGLALKLGNKNLSRWVGKLCSLNPIPVIYPCHRVLAKNNLGGFNAGVELKIHLLKLEGIKLP